MDKQITFDPQLTKDDRLVLDNLVADIQKQGSTSKTNEPSSSSRPNVDKDTASASASVPDDDKSLLELLKSMNTPSSENCDPTVFTSWDLADFNKKSLFYIWILEPYVGCARKIVRKETDVVMVTHLLLYFTTSVPSAVMLYWRGFTWLHGIAHLMMQGTYVGTYTLMMHQHIHTGGVLAKKFNVFDKLFPYITDPLMGHTWNTYYYHHIKHHHVEGNGPNDLSSTLRFQRDSFTHFLIYLGRFFFFIWAELSLYFIQKRRYKLAAGLLFSEWANYTTYAVLFWLNPKSTVFVFLLPLLLMRIGLMAGNWGQHAFVDHDEPDSDYRSSITLIDSMVSSMLHCLVYHGLTELIKHAVGLEQSPLLQRWLSHITSSQPLTALARSSHLFHQRKGAVCCRGCLSKPIYISDTIKICDANDIVRLRRSSTISIIS